MLLKVIIGSCPHDESAGQDSGEGGSCVCQKIDIYKRFRFGGYFSSIESILSDLKHCHMVVFHKVKKDSDGMIVATFT